VPRRPHHGLEPRAIKHPPRRNQTHARTSIPALPIGRGTPPSLHGPTCQGYQNRRCAGWGERASSTAGTDACPAWGTTTRSDDGSAPLLGTALGSLAAGVVVGGGTTARARERHVRWAHGCAAREISCMQLDQWNNVLIKKTAGYSSTGRGSIYVL
jgi:hypothetical protein